VWLGSDPQVTRSREWSTAGGVGAAGYQVPPSQHQDHLRSDLCRRCFVTAGASKQAALLCCQPVLSLPTYLVVFADLQGEIGSKNQQGHSPGSSLRL
jgi:hypothetical protein